MEGEKQDFLRDAIDGMLEMGRLHRVVCDRELSNMGLYHSQHRMLKHLYDRGGVSSQRILAQEMHITPAVVTVTLKKLEAGGYVVRKTAPEDKRVSGIGLTDAGRQIVEQTRAKLERTDAAMFSGFSDEELQQVLAFYRRMKENLTRI